MDSWHVLPPVAIQPVGPLSAEIIARGIPDFRAAGRYLQGLPYGRTVDRADFRAVLREGKGTCSTKHALLAALAQEQDLPAAAQTQRSVCWISRPCGCEGECPVSGGMQICTRESASLQVR
jgi:hypothetical protein